MDNFSMYGNNIGLMTQGVWAQVTAECHLVADPDAAAAAQGSIVLEVDAFTAILPIARYVLNTAEQICGIAERIWMGNLPSGDFDRPNVMEWRDADNNVMAYVIIETTGRVTFAWETGSITTTNPVISAGGWYHFEGKYDTTGAGAFELRIEGITVLTQDGLGYGGHLPVYQVAYTFNASNFTGTKSFVKDWVVWDGSGAQNNDFIGAVVIYSLEPVSDVALNWTPVGGPNGYSILQDSPPNDAEYISAPYPAPAPYQAALSQLPADVTSVRAVMTMVRASKTDGGDGKLQASVISDPAAPATALGANRTITTAQTYWRDVFETDPKTVAAWLPSAVNEIELQLNRTL